MKWFFRAILEIIRVPMLAIWRLQGWEMEHLLPDLPQYVIVAVPHTTNWDYWHMLCMSITCRRRPNVTMKKEWFRFPILSFIVRALGAIPIDRSKNTNMIDQMAELFKQRPRVVLVFTVEGSRRYTEYWRTGFYYTAFKAGVPIVCGYVDYKRKRCGASLIVYPTGDLEADFEIMKAYLEKVGRNGLYPQNVSALAIKPVDKA